MRPLELAQQLVNTDADSRAALIVKHQNISSVEVAESLQQLCYEAWTEDPQQVPFIADAAQSLATMADVAEVRGYAEWTQAIRKIVEGDLPTSIENIDRSQSTFSGIGNDHLAAKTQTAKLYSLAMLGRYDEAVACGHKALAVFLEHNDLYSAGKIEHNIGNLYWRRDMYRESEPYLESARQRFAAIDDQRQIAMVENCQAFVKTQQNQFRDAEILYKSALERTAANGLTVTEAEIAIGLSNLYLFESKYDLALRFMEQSRLKYEQLEMPNQSALCELEMADIYLELNLLPEALEFYEKVAVRLSNLGLQAELARCSLSHARALIRQNEFDKANRLLDRAENLYTLEGNSVAVGSVRLARSQLLLDQGNVANADEQVNLALSFFEESDNLRLSLFARWLRAEITNTSGRKSDAVAEMEATLLLAKKESKEVEYLCLTSLGKITRSEHYLESAIDLVEHSRGRLSTDELRTSFFADRIVPYNELIKIKFSKQQFEDAFRLHERSRARTLVEQLYQPRSAESSNKHLARLREELNGYYRRINTSSLAGTDERSRIGKLRNLALEREKEYSEMLRRLGASYDAPINGTTEVDIGEFRSKLDDTTLIEFASIDGQLSAFLISKDGFTAMPNYADEATINEEIKNFLFQIKTGRFIDRLSDANREAALSRLHSHSCRVYDILLRPIESLLRTSRLVFAPSGLLNYLPFPALHTGREYLIESVEVCRTPSLSVLDHCLNKPSAKYERALIVGVSDAINPMVDSEVKEITECFAHSVKLEGEAVTVEKIKQNTAGADVVHFACHGKFRPDNPGFSSLSLHSEELTINEVRNLRLDNSVVVLSACESGLNDVVRGEELIGLTRAFFAAGAATLVLSFWRVNDEATHQLMTSFYGDFCAGDGPARSLRLAQRRMIDNNIHPYFWAPFMVSGRW